MKVMKAELASVGLSEEEILDKTQKLMKVYRYKNDIFKFDDI